MGVPSTPAPVALRRPLRPPILRGLGERASLTTDLLYELVVRDVRLHYRRSVLGVAWSQLGPLSFLAVLTFLFTRVVPLGIPDYPTFVFTGLLTWTWFSGAMVSATGSVVSARDLVGRPGFPATLLPVTAITTQLVHFLLALPVLLAVAAFTGRLTLFVALLPVLVAVQFVVSLGPGLVLAACNVRFRDTAHLVSVAMTPLFYATPVFYRHDSIPEGFSLVHRLNPMAHLVGAYRDVVYAGRAPDAGSLAVLLAVGAIGALLGYRFFASQSDRFAEEL